MRELISTKAFARRYQRLLVRQTQLAPKILSTLEALERDPFQPSLETHKLKGKLEGRWACSVAYDLRIIFRFEEQQPPAEQAIILLDIGTHDEVY